MFEEILPAIIDSKVYIKVFKAFVPKNSFMLENISLKIWRWYYMIQKGNSNPLSVSDEHLISHYNRAIARFFKLEGGEGALSWVPKAQALSGGGWA